MHTRPSHGGTVEPAQAAAQAERLPDPKPESEHATRLLLTVWVGDAGRWRARAEWPGDETHDFDSPFELARFLTQLTDRRVPAHEPAAGNGLR